MKFGWTLFLAKRHLASPLKRGVRLVMVLATLGIALGAATLTLTQAVSSGLERLFMESILGFNAHLVVLKQGEMEDPNAEEKQLRDLVGDELLTATPFLYREGLILSKGKVQGAVLKGIDPLTFARVYAVKVRPRIGSQVLANIENLLAGPEEIPPLVLGQDLAEDLGITGEGELIKVFIPLKEEGKTGAGSFRAFRVKGVFQTGVYEFDHGFAFLDITRMQQMFGVEGKVTGIEAKLKNPERADFFAEELKENLRLPYDVISWQKLNGPLFRALRLERILFFVVMSMVVVVAAFNIVGVLLLMIFDKSREISILRALGARRAELKAIFGWQGMTLGLSGCLMGVVLGGVIGWVLRFTQWIHPTKEVYLVDRFPVDFSLSVLGSVFGVTLLIAFLVTQFGVTRINKAPLDL